VKKNNAKAVLGVPPRRMEMKKFKIRGKIPNESLQHGKEQDFLK